MTKRRTYRCGLCHPKDSVQAEPVIVYDYIELMEHLSEAHTEDEVRGEFGDAAHLTDPHSN
jgi:hypothetical protein